MAEKVKRWTPDKVREVLQYLKTHSGAETRAHFAPLSTSQVHYWQQDVKRGKPFGASQNEAGRRAHKTKKKATTHPGKSGPKPKANGNGHVLEGLSRREALTWLQRFHAAYMAQVKAETPTAIDVLEALGGVQ